MDDVLLPGGRVTSTILIIEVTNQIGEGDAPTHFIDITRWMPLISVSKCALQLRRQKLCRDH